MAGNDSIQSQDVGIESPKEETMLIRYSCKDMGLNCYFMVKGETMEEVTQKALEHIQENHSEEFNSILTPEQIDEMYKVLARSTRVVTS
jgi:predicted small metal-binding protein